VLAPGIWSQGAGAEAAHSCADTSRDTGHTRSVTCPTVAGCVASSSVLLTCLQWAWRVGEILLTQPGCDNLIQKKRRFTHTHTHTHTHTLTQTHSPVLCSVNLETKNKKCLNPKVRDCHKLQVGENKTLGEFWS
jgi:uncharacterized C2H2 Zn-finger protein